MAEGLAKKLYGSRHRIESAGSQPTKVNPYAIKALKDLNIDILGHHSKTVDQLPKDFVDSLDVVITLCAEEVCPVLSTKAKRLHWPLPDPAGVQGTEAEKLAKFCEIRDEIFRRLHQLRLED